VSVNFCTFSFDMNMHVKAHMSRINLKAFFVTLLLLVVAHLGVVLYVDPLWLHDHEFSWNQYQKAYDERLTKTIRLVYGAENGRFDAVSLGSSRGTYLPVADFDDYRVFNYAVSSLYPGEYLKMLELFAREQGEPHAIIIGADFFGSRNDWADRIGPYIDEVSEPGFLFKRLLSVDTLQWAMNEARANKTGKYPSPGKELYDRSMRKELYRHDNWTPYYKPMLSKYCRIVYGRSYTWNRELPQLFAALKERFPNTRFIIYTSPTMGTFYDALIFRERLDDYMRWLALLVETFGEVYDLMGHNEFTDNPDNYYDYHHFAAGAGMWLIDNVLEQQTPKIGALVTRDSLDAYLRVKAVEAQRILNERENPCAGWQPHV